jgi:MYXO-CTERM domain-containing protein
VERALLFPVALVGLAATVPSLASAQIFQPGTQPVGHTDGIETLIQSSAPCRTCHAGYDDTSDYEPWESWRGSLMGSAQRDPVFRAGLAIAEVDNADAADFCVRCHSPGAWLRGRSEVPEYDAAATPPARFIADDPRRQPSDDLDGVSCMVCHRANDPGDAQLFNARLVLNDGVLGDTRYGPYEYEPGVEAGHPTLLGTFQSQARLCGSCHDIDNPIAMGHFVDDTGTVQDTTRSFAIERTYSEWNASAFATRGDTCQGCHMPVVDHPVQAAAFGSFPDTLRDEMNRHDLLGAASWQLRAIAATIPDPSAMVAHNLTANADRIDAFMQTAASVEILASALAGDEATATVRVTNLTGHKLPTGYPEGRRMWLEMDVLDSGDHVVAGSARYDATTGMLEADPQAHTYEVHYGTMQPDRSVVPSFHFVENDTVMLDTRIPPEGFMPPEDRDMLPRGRDYLDPTTGEYRNFDEVSYTLPSLCGTGTLRLRARLRYQATTREYAEFLRDTAPPSLDPAMAGQSYGDVAFDAWMTHGGSTPIEIAEATVDLGAAIAACPEPPDAGVDAGTIDAAVAVIDAGAADGGTVTPPATGGCGCRAGGHGSSSAALVALVGLAIVVTRRRRR